VVGLRDGLIVFDGPSSSINNDVLTSIYGEEDWETEASNHAGRTREESDTAKADAPDLIGRY
jgi:phosphonate transport system ATP-binding protein